MSDEVQQDDDLVIVVMIAAFLHVDPAPQIAAFGLP
jgi:hypothetical protein